MILFAYAGNMDTGTFKKNAPSAHKIAIARLPGYRFAFNKMADDESAKANIVPVADAAECVWGILIKLRDEEKSNFFNPQGWSKDFKLESVTCIDIEDNLHHAEAFAALPHAVNTSLLPYDWYYHKILKLAEASGLPEDYIRKIKLMGYKTDPDKERRRKKLKAIGLPAV